MDSLRREAAGPKAAEVVVEQEAGAAAPSGQEASDRSARERRWCRGWLDS